MAKYKTEFKVKVVKEYLEGNVSYKDLAKKYSIPDKHIVRTWVNAYESQGYEGLKVSRKNNNYSLDLKLNVVDLYLTGEMSYQSLANELKINNPSIIARWVTEFREKGIDGLKPNKRGRPSKMPNIHNKTKDIKLETSVKQTNEEDSLSQLKEEIKKLKEQNYWLQLENEVIKKR